MKTQYHQYRGIGHIIRVFVAWSLVFLSIALSLVIVAGILTTEWHLYDEISTGAVCDGLILLGGPPMGALIGLALANMFPKIGTHAHYLTVSFCFRELQVPWENIVGVTRVWYPVAKPLYSVRVKRLFPKE